MDITLAVEKYRKAVTRFNDDRNTRELHAAQDEYARELKSWSVYQNGVRDAIDGIDRKAYMGCFAELYSQGYEKGLELHTDNVLRIPMPLAAADLQEELFSERGQTGVEMGN